MREAQKFNHSPFEVLPDLNISVNLYTTFVIKKILNKEEDTIENVLEDLKLFDSQKVKLVFEQMLKENGERFNEIGQILKDLGVKYYDQFEEHINDFDSDEEAEAMFHF